MVKIYGTIGPACRDREVLTEMFREGMDGVRLNLSHTSLEDAAALTAACRAAAEEAGAEPALLIDMQGPELRTGVTNEPVLISEGEELLLDDGKILLVTEREAGRTGTFLRVVRGGLLESRKSIAVPGYHIDAPAMTDRDREQIKRAKDFGVTAVMQPFVRSREDLDEVRTALDEAGCRDVRLLAKIENLDGVERLEELIPRCDEIVIARGDLGNAMDLWELPAVQKKIAAACREAGRDFMVVTQMLDSMTHRRVPTRAEVSDIFNAVLDGAASVMVTGETAAGKYPADVIRYLYRTAREAERMMQGQRKTGEHN